MSSQQPHKTRAEFVASVRLPPGARERAWHLVRRSDVVLRLLICFAATVVLWTITTGWQPPLEFREGDSPARDVVARVNFDVPDDTRTRELQARAKQSVECIYQNDPQPLVEVRQKLKGQVFELLAAESLSDVAAIWSDFAVPGQQPGGHEEDRTEFDAFVAALSDDQDLNAFDRKVAAALSPFERTGLLEKIEHGEQDGRMTEIRVFRGSDPQQSTRVAIRDVLIPEATVRDRLRDGLREQLGNNVLADHVFGWLHGHLEKTLTFREQATQVAAEKLAQQVAPVFRPYDRDDVLAARGNPLSQRDMALLHAEHAAYVQTLSTGWRLAFMLARWGLFASLFGLCGAFLYYRRPADLFELRGMLNLLGLVIITVAITVALCWWGTRRFHVEIIPLLLFAMTLAIVYRHDVALILSAALALAVTLCMGQGIHGYVTILVGLATTLLLLPRIRTRSQLVYVGLAAGAVVLLTSIGVEMVRGHVGWHALLERACWEGAYVVISGLLMTGILPFVENWFDVQTDLSLLELADVAHPLLQELLRRAPGTYNHSVNVASLAETAADAIGANGLLVRVGAYYHDIGKMLKPSYFVENQLGAPNRHDTLPPTMSTLVIIAHVKDGADLARNHHLPSVVIDFIQQHHGTTLVEYFYRQASLKTNQDPDGCEVDEGSYRYPGPKPRTREAAVLMLADAAESATRSLSDPAPSRIENLVEELAMKRLMDGQFDECGLTLQQLRTIQDSLVKSISAIHHGRIKYPDQHTA